MKKFGKFCGITALILGILGIVFVVGGFAAGASLVTLRNSTAYEEGDYGHDIFHFWKNWKVYSGSSKMKDQTSDTFDASQIREILVDIQYGDVTVCSADEADNKPEPGNILVEKKTDDQQTIDVKAENGVLSITEDEDSSSWWNISGRNEWDSEVKIYVPEGIQLDFVSLENGCGDVELKGALNIAELSVDLSVGDVKIENGIRVSGNVDVTCDTGDIKMEDMICQGDFSADASVGDISVQGQIIGNVEAKSSTGSIDFRLSGDKDSYNYDITTDVGDVKLNGRTYDSVSQDVKITNNAEGSTITLATDVGDVKLEVN